jgi:hypothetical protein
MLKTCLTEDDILVPEKKKRMATITPLYESGKARGMFMDLLEDVCSVHGVEGVYVIDLQYPLTVGRDGGVVKEGLGGMQNGLTA